MRACQKNNARPLGARASQEGIYARRESARLMVLVVSRTHLKVIVHCTRTTCQKNNARPLGARASQEGIYARRESARLMVLVVSRTHLKVIVHCTRTTAPRGDEYKFSSNAAPTAQPGRGPGTRWSNARGRTRRGGIRRSGSACRCAGHAGTSRWMPALPRGPLPPSGRSSCPRSGACPQPRDGSRPPRRMRRRTRGYRQHGRAHRGPRRGWRRCIRRGRGRESDTCSIAARGRARWPGST